MEPPSCWIFLHIHFSAATPADVLYACLLLLLLFFSAFFSGTETAYFSLSPQDIDKLKREESKAAQRVLAHLAKSDQLLGTILVGNNLVNIAIILLSTFLINKFVTYPTPLIGFLVQTVCVTFLLVLFGEVLPKTFTTQYGLPFTKKTTPLLNVAAKLLQPFSRLLAYMADRMNKYFRNIRSNVSIDELSQAVDITESQSAEDKKILKGIVRFVNIDVHEVMRPRVNVDAVELHMNFAAVRRKMVEYGYSRLPVYDKTLDHVNGILYVKDLLPYLNTEEADFAWQPLIRAAYFVPENKKINDLLEEFRQRKIHMAIVVDEYGGTEGIVTLEDILEEIVGEISDETD
ncbi:MAG: gliding motility-associated protein GldE [Prevotellaceae bacterium]|nr:gliding motility-associated protein GldE [Prevotellaceae bacterium]